MQDSSPNMQPQSMPEPVFSGDASMTPPQSGSTSGGGLNNLPLTQASEAIATTLLQTVNNPRVRLEQIAAIKAAYIKDQFGI